MSMFRKGSVLQPGQSSADEQLVSESNLLVVDEPAPGLSRRRFLARAGLAAGAAGTVAIAGCNEGNNTGVTVPAPTTTVSVEDVLNFALNLEYLEATFYLTLTTGSGLPSADMGSNPGPITGGLTKVTFTDPGVQALANQLAADELAHVQFLRATMQSLNFTPVDMPALNLAALNSQSGAITSDYQFLDYARQLETTGVSAYEGAIASLVSVPAALAYAAQIHATEGQHAGMLRQYCVANQVYSNAVDSGDIPPTSPTVIFNTSATTGLNTVRTTSQVLMIVYGNTAAGVTSGGFYPNGMNGNIKST